MMKLLNNIKLIWYNYWWQWVGRSNLIGGRPSGWKVFRWERLFPVCMGLAVIGIIIFLIVEY